MANRPSARLVIADLPASWPIFVDALVNGAKPRKAAAMAGFTDTAHTAPLLMRHPTVRKALVAATQARLEGEAAPLALRTVLEVLSDPEAPGAVRAKLALGVLDRIQPPKDDRAAADKPLHELTVSELAALAEQLRSASPPAPQMRNVTPDAKGEPA